MNIKSPKSFYSLTEEQVVTDTSVENEDEKYYLCVKYTVLLFLSLSFNQ